MIKTCSLLGPLCVAFTSLMILPVDAQNPHWIWHDNKGKSIKTNEECKKELKRLEF